MRDWTTLQQLAGLAGVGYLGALVNHLTFGRADRRRAELADRAARRWRSRALQAEGRKAVRHRRRIDTETVRR